MKNHFEYTKFRITAGLNVFKENTPEMKNASNKCRFEKPGAC